MFEFLLADPYEQRKVARYDAIWGFVSTASVNDGAQPYETAVEHPDYNEGDMVIVQAYDSKEEAIAGHNQWVTRMTHDPLPPALIDCGNSHIQQFCDTIGLENTFPRKER